MFKLLRPEFVRRNPVPLSSDAFSKFGKDGELEHNSEVLEATVRLEGQVVPEFARYLDLRYADGPILGDDLTAQQQDTALLFDDDSPATTLARNPHRKLEELSQLVAEMHLRGINVRYALAIHSLLTTSLISKLLLTEVVARSAKHIIDDMWRGLDSAPSDLFHRETANFFSTLFSLDSDSAELWNSVIAAEVDERFGLTLRLVRTPDMPLTVDPPAATSAIQGFQPLRNSGSGPSFNAPASLQNSNESSSSRDSRPSAPGSLRTSNPRNQIRVSATSPAASPFNSLNSEASLNAVDGNLLRKGIDPTLLFFRICQLCGIELDFTAWNLPSPPAPEPSGLNNLNTFNLNSISSGSGSFPFMSSSSSIPRVPSSTSIRTSNGTVAPSATSTNQTVQTSKDAEESFSIDGSQEDSLAVYWLKVDHFLGSSWANSLSNAASLGASLESELNKRIPSLAIKRIIARTKYLNRISYEEGTALSRLALSKTGQESFDLLSRANRKFRECLEIKPDDSRALLNWALVLTKQAELLDNPKSLQGSQPIYSPHHTSNSLWKEAFAKYERALVLRPTDWRALTSWGTALSTLASRSKDGCSLYRQAIEKFDQALRLLPMPHFQPLYNAANARLKLARLTLDELRSSRTVRVDKSIQIHRDASDVLTASICGFQDALDIEGTNVNAMHNLAVALATQARIYVQASSPLSSSDASSSSGSSFTPAAITERDRLYRAAYLVYQRAIHLMPTSVDIYYGWGNALFRHALAMRETSSGAVDDHQAFSTMCSAAMRYHAAITISQTDEASFSRDIFINFGNVLMLGAKLSARLRATLPASFMAGCACYLKLVELPAISETEHASITPVLIALKRYVPKDPSENQPPHVPTSLTMTQKSVKQPERVNTKATELLSQLGASDSEGSGLSGSGGGNNYDPSSDIPISPDAITNTKTKKKRRGSTIVIDSKVVSSVSPSPGSTSASTSTSSPGSQPPLTRKKSAKTVVLEGHPSKSESSKKISPKLELPRSESPSAAQQQQTSYSPPLSPSSETIPSPTSPSSSSTTGNPSAADTADSIGRATRQGTTSKLRQKLGSFFGKLKGSSSSISAASPSTTPPPSSPSATPKSEIIPLSPKGSPSENHIRNNSSLSSSATYVPPGAQKTRSKLKPARSLSYAEDDHRPRAPSASSTSSTSIVASSNSAGKHERGGSDADRSASSAVSGPLPATPDTNNSPLSARESRTTEISPAPRSRRRSDADSQPPLRRQSTTTGITTLRGTQSSPLTQSSPQIARTKIKSGGDYSSLNNETIAQLGKEPRSDHPASPSSSSSPTAIEKDALPLKAAFIGSSVSLSTSGGASRGTEIVGGGGGGDDSITASKSKEERKSRSKINSGIKKEKSSRTSSKASPSSSNSKRKSSSNAAGRSKTSSPASKALTAAPKQTLPTQLDWSKQVLFAWDGAQTVQESEFVVRGVLGTSRSGLVFAARRGTLDYAMKVRHPDAWQMNNKPKLAPLLDHPFIIRPKHLLVVDSKLVMTWSLVRGPQLLDYVDHLGRIAKAKQQPSLPPPTPGQPAIEFPRLDHLVLNLVTAQLVSVFCYLSEVAKMPYRDFKPSNVLINDTGNLVLTVHMEEDQATLAYARADVSFLSPEIVLKIRERRALAAALGQGASKSMNIVDDAANRVEDERAMWWTLGMYLLVLATGSNPLRSEDPMKMEENVVHKKLVLPLHLGKFSNLLAGLLDRDITSRLCTPDQVRKHPYFHNMDWNKLLTLGYHPPFLPNISAQEPKSALSDSSNRSMSQATKSAASLNSSSLETSLDLSSTLGSTMGAQIALMNTMVMPDIGNQLEGNTAFIQNTSMIEDDLCASSSASESDSS